MSIVKVGAVLNGEKSTIYQWNFLLLDAVECVSSALKFVYTIQDFLTLEELRNGL